MPSPKVAEKRSSPRYPLERLAKMEPRDGTPPRYCLITDISGGGARINTFGVNVPDEFVLRLSGDGPAKDGTYRVIWRVGHDVGAQLVSRDTGLNRTRRTREPTAT
jgi:hypothetical protein